MTKITILSEGMMCAMCEAHMDEVFRNKLEIKKITSTHSDGKTVVLTEKDISDDMIREAVEEAGYKFVSASREPYEKKGLFSFLTK